MEKKKVKKRCKFDWKTGFFQGGRNYFHFDFTQPIIKGLVSNYPLIIYGLPPFKYNGDPNSVKGCQTAFLIFPDRIHRVQTLRCWVDFPSITRTLFKLG